MPITPTTTSTTTPHQNKNLEELEERTEPMSVTTTSAPTVISTDASSSRTSTMIPSIRSEWIKTWSLRSNWILSGLAFTLAAVAVWAIATYSKEPTTAFELVTGPTVLTTVFCVVAGVLAHTSEEQHDTLASSLMGQPSRSVFVAAKVSMAAVLGLVIGVLSVAGAVLGAVIAGENTADIFSDGVMHAGWGLVLTTAAAIFGLGLGLIVRHSAAAISGILAWWLIIELILVSIVPERFSRFLPFNSAYAIIGQSEGDFGSGLALSPTQATLCYAAYAVFFVVAGTFLLGRRDIK